MSHDGLGGASLRSLPEVPLVAPGYVHLVFAIVLVWGFGDAVSTLFAARFAGVGLEANPWIRVLLTVDPLAVIALKMAVVLYVGVVLLACRSVVEQVPWWRGWLLGIVALGVGAVVTNVYVDLLAAPSLL